MANPIQCLKDKVLSGEINESLGKRLINRAEALDGHFQDPTKSSEIAIASLENEASALSRQQSRLVEVDLNVQKAAKEVTSDKEARNLLNKLTQTDHQNVRNGHRVAFGSHVSTGISKDFKRRDFVGLSEADNMSMANAIISGSAGPKHLRHTIEGFQDSYKVINNTLLELGAPGAAAHKPNFIPLDIQPGSVVNKTSKEFKEAIKEMADIDHLVENSPFFHRFKGGLDEYLDLAHKVYTGGASLYAAELRALKVGPGEFKDIFARSLKANSAESWQKFDQVLGNKTGDLMASFMSYSERMANYTSRLEMYGNDSKSYLKSVETHLGKWDIQEKMGKAKKDLGYIDSGSESHIFPNRVKLGTLGNVPIYWNPEKIVSSLAALNPWLLLKGAVIMAAVGDGQYAKAVSKEIGGKSATRAASIFRTFKGENVIDMFADAREVAARTAASINFYSDALTDTVRGLETGVGMKFIDSSSSWLLRVAGLTPLTNINRVANVNNTMYNLAEMSDLGWNGLEPRLRSMFARFGIGEAEWEVLKKTAITAETGGNMMNAGAILDSNLPLARKFASFMALVQEKGTPTSSPKMSQWIQQQAQVGVANSLMARAVGTFQGFNSSVWTNWTLESTTGKGRGSLYAQLIANTTLIGIIGLTAHNASNNETTNFSDPNTYLEGMLKGGALGIVADVGTTLLGMKANYGGIRGALARTTTGVAGGTIIDTAEAITRAANNALAGKETKLASDLFSVADKYNVLEKNLYFGLAMKPVFDNFRSWLAPKKFYKKEKRKARRRLKEGVETLID